MRKLLNFINQYSLIQQIFIGLILGIIIGFTSSTTAHALQLLGDIFVNGLKAIAPLLVFCLIMAAVARHKVNADNTQAAIRPILLLYVLGTFSGA